MIDGQGFMWWMRELLQKNPYNRPNLVNFRRVRNSEWTGVKLMNSAYYHLNVRDIDQAYFHDFEIEVDVASQHHLSKLISALPFPLNTDGIDPAGSNILIERVNITNYDDAVAVKPSDKKYKLAQCSENIMVRDMKVWWSVGLTIGSVPAEDDYNCIRNVTFQDSVMHHPYKGIYVKTNPGDTTSMLPGSGGEITDITYDNIEIHNPVWWGIYIGPQQQKQPGGGGPGCMTYPFGGCETNPRIAMNNITLNNIRQYDSLLPPGIIRCNETAECHGFVWNNVHATGLGGWWEFLGLNFISEHVHGEVTDSTPNPGLDGKVHHFKLGKFAKKFLKKEAIKIAKHFICSHLSWLPCEEFGEKLETLYAV